MCISTFLLSCTLGYYHKVCVISPQGTAVFWYNLFKSGEGDYRTRHAACPVLVGSKWGESKFRFITMNCSNSNQTWKSLPSAICRRDVCNIWCSCVILPTSLFIELLQQAIASHFWHPWCSWSSCYLWCEKDILVKKYTLIFVVIRVGAIIKVNQSNWSLSAQCCLTGCNMYI